MEKRKALGRGLEALIPVSSEPKNLQSIVNINVTDIISNKYQPRQNFSSPGMQELITSIREKGFIQPLIVRRIPSGYELIAGERRLRAAKELGLAQVPVIIKDVKEERDLLELALIENLQREDLNPIEKAQAYKRLIEEFGLSQEEVARRVGKEVISIINTLRILRLPAEIQEKIAQGELSEGHARAILSLDDIQAQIRFAQLIVEQGLSVREAENRARKLKGKKRKKSPDFSKRDPQVQVWEEELQHIFGTKVRIMHRRERGKIEMEYYSLPDLERLVHLLEKAK
ncbi:MAG: ParB/RepB/Spo0J family partition protein [Candidatus Omnitrophica bacterium]|nr:ParB/RepB/Spo0J family partition protein [Candidatus Omnitrophota bacterium]MCM8798330.1 ParB/RepB/Spo0J family partition protein [Candidatus Omnitrophota bacterium]